MFQGGVEQRVTWVKYDGVGRTVRNGLNFTERGFGVRAALGCSDRGHTAISQLKPGDIDWDEIFGRLGARWFHTGGIFCALSETTPLVAEEAMKAARANGTIISYDLNYRESLWKSIGGQAKAREVNRRLAPYIDVMLGNEEDFSAALGFEVARRRRAPERARSGQLQDDDRDGRRARIRTCASSARRSGTRPRRPSTTGVRSRGPTARSTKRRRARASRSGTALAAATRSPRVSSTGCSPPGVRSSPSSAAPHTAPSR